MEAAGEERAEEVPAGQASSVGALCRCVVVLLCRCVVVSLSEGFSQ